MSGKRILDAIALLRASRNVVYNHFTIRLSQAELYTKTSSITKLLRQRYPVVTSTISQQFSQSSSTNDDGIPQTNKKSGPEVKLDESQGLKQDHHYDKSEQNSAAAPAAQADIEVEQAKADRYPTPDGSIPPSSSPIGEQSGDPESEYKRPIVGSAQRPINQDENATLNPRSSNESTIPVPGKSPLSPDEARVAQRLSEDQIPATSAEPPTVDAEFSVEQEKDVYYQPPGQVKPVLSALPRVRLPKTENDVQGGDSHIPEGINADVFYSGAENDAPEPSEEQLAQLFHSPRSARLIGKKERYLPGGSVRKFHTVTKNRQQHNETEKEDLKQLAQDMAKDVQSSEVSSQLYLHDLC